MKVLTFSSFLALIVASSALAHIEPGVWTGVSLAGKECVLEVYEQSFDRDVRHPLNERIRVRVNGDEFKIYHPRTVDVKKGLVSMNHDRFEGILATAMGSNALVIDMMHSKEFEGPTGYKWIEDNWKTNKSGTITCLKLRHRGR